MVKGKIICDTDVLIDYFEKRKTRHHKTVDIIENQIGLENILISCISQMEIITGTKNKLDLALIDSQLSNFDIVPLNGTISMLAVGLLKNYHLSHKIGLADSMIAATALSLELQLFTYNLKDYRFLSKLELFSTTINS